MQTVFRSAECSATGHIRALLVLEGARYGTVATRNYSNKLLAWANRPLLDYTDADSITDALQSIEEIGNQWSDKLGLKALGDRAQVPWHLCEAVKDDETEAGAGPIDKLAVGKPMSTSAKQMSDLNLIYCGPPGTGKTY